MDKWLKNNNVLKILSFLLALMLWMVVNMGQEIPTKSSSTEDIKNTFFYEAQVSPVYNEEEFVVNMSIEEVKVTLHGNSEMINQIRNGINIDKGQFYVDLSKNKAGTVLAPVHVKGFPSDIEVEIEPSLIQVTLEAKQRKEFEVFVDKLGKEEDGYQSGESIIKPKKAHILGTEEQIAQVAFIKAFVNVDHVKSPILQQVPLRALDKNGNVVQVEVIPQTVEVQIPVTSPYITVPATYNIEKYPIEGYAIESIHQITKEVTLYGSKDIINGYSVYVGPSIDLSDVKEGKHTLTYPLAIDPHLLKTEPNAIELEVTIVQSETKTISPVSIEVHGLSEGLSAKIITPTDGLDMIIEGAPKNIEPITNQELQAFVDVTNLPPGEHEVEIQYNVPLLIKRIGEIETAKVEIIKE